MVRHTQIPLDPRQTTYIARQPILDWSRRVVGYELLYRGGANDTTCQANYDVASARVVNDALLSFDIETLTGGRPAFFNVTRELLLSEAVTLLPVETTVIELHEDVAAGPEVIDACRRLHGMKYAIALDDFTEGGGADELLPFVRFVKVDVLSTEPAAWKALAQRLRPRGVVLVAEKVETAKMAEETRAAGYSLFQGYYFCKPATRGMASIPGRRLAYLNLFSALNKPNLSMIELEDLVKHDVSLSHRVLRSVNAAAFAQQREVQSIRHALLLLGTDHIRKWCSVWALSGVNGSGAFETVVVTLLRARCCELAGAALSGSEDGGEYFLLGLCSLLDVLLGVPMAEAIDKIPLQKSIKDALLGEANPARRVLDTVVAYERGEWNVADEGARALGMSTDVLPAAYADALRWAREFLPASAAA